MNQKEMDKSLSQIDNMQIAPNLTVKDWKELNLNYPASPAWGRAADLFQARIFTRFIEPADILISASKKDSSKLVGFAVLALDFIVIETIQGFREGHIKHTKRNSEGKEYPISGALIKTFLTRDPSFSAFFRTRDHAKQIYDAVRCNISHMGQTAVNVRVNIKNPVSMIAMDSESGEITINRNLFHEAVIDSLNRYCREIREGNDLTLRNNFFNKMNAICGIRNTT